MDHIDSDLVGELDKAVKSIKDAKADISKELLSVVAYVDLIIRDCKISKEVRKSLYRVCEQLEDLEFSINPKKPSNSLI